MRLSRPIIALGLAAPLIALSACTTSAPMADVTRFHLGQPIPTDSIAITTATTGLEADANTAAIAAELARLGFTLAAGGAPSAYVASYRLEQLTQEGPPKPPRFSIGIGGGTGSFGRGGGFGVGASTNVPVGATRRGDTQLNTLLTLDIKRRSDNSVVWEGRASRASLAKEGNPVPGLARALFANFPGPSGQMVQAPAK